MSKYLSILKYFNINKKEQRALIYQPESELENEIKDFISKNKIYVARSIRFLFLDGRDIIMRAEQNSPASPVRINFDRTYLQLLVESYSRISHVEHIEDIDKILNEEYIMNELRKKSIYGGWIDLEFLQNMYYPTEQWHSLYAEKWRDVSDSILRGFDFSSSNKTYDWLDDEMHHHKHDVLKCRGVMYQFSYIKATLKASLLVHKYSDLVKDSEIMRMYKNSINTNKENIFLLYSIYTELYPDMFPELLNVSNFNFLIKSTFDANTRDTGSYLKASEEYLENLNKNGERVEFKNFSSLVSHSEILQNLYRKYPSFKYDKKNVYSTCFSGFVESLLTLHIKNMSLYELSLLLLSEGMSFDSYLECEKRLKLDRERKKLLKPNSCSSASLDVDKFNSISSWEEFENYLEGLYSEMGYSVLLTRKGSDQGADLIVEKNGVKFAIQAKFYSTPVGNKAVQEVIGSLCYYGATKGIVITNSTFTKSAEDLAQCNNVELINGESLELLRKHIYGY